MKLCLFADAARELERLVVEHPDDAVIHSLLGECLYEEERYDEACNALRTALRIRPENDDDRWFLAYCLNASNRSEEALIEISSANVAHRPARWFNLRGLIRAGQDNLAAAISEYAAGLELDPTDTDLLNNLGVALRDLKRFDEAESCFHRTLQFEAQNSFALAELGFLLARKGAPEEAVELLARAVAQSPSRSWNYFYLAAALEDLGNIEGARHALERGLDLEPGTGGRLLSRFEARHPNPPQSC